MMIAHSVCRVVSTNRVLTDFSIFFGVCMTLTPRVTMADEPRPSTLDQQIGSIRSVPDDKRGKYTSELALKIRRLPATEMKVVRAMSVAFVATEGDFGRDNLQAVTTTLEEALHEKPTYKNDSKTAEQGYDCLVRLVHFEGMKAKYQTAEFDEALRKVAANEKRIENAENVNFTLKDLKGKSWMLKELNGKVVVINFWATWCPPCRKELPDIEALYRQFKEKGLVVLAITDEKADVVTKWLTTNPHSFPLLIDTDRKVNNLFNVAGIPYTAIYNRNGRLAAQAIDMRTKKQFLELLNKAGLK